MPTKYFSVEFVRDLGIRFPKTLYLAHSLCIKLVDV